jgi:threonine dehydratase
MIILKLLLLLISPLCANALSNADLPTASGVAAAYEGFASLPVVRTPLLESPLLNQELNCRLLVKAECLQRTGSFKFRGALNRLTRLDKKSAEKGVVAFSSGNFGQALAAAATSLDIPCCIVSPHDAPAVKLERIEKFGANLVLSTAKPDENREVVASALAQEISSNKGMELLDQSYELLGSYPDVIIIPCGGGGLTAGVNLAVEQQEARSQVYTIEPKGFDDHAQSFRAKKRMSLAEVYPSGNPDDRSVYCDALMAGAPGQITWSINGPRLAGALESLGDDSVARAMKVAFDHYRLVLEPSGALALAAVLDKQVDMTNKTVVIIASGGNTDLETFAKLMGCTGMD